MWFRKKKVEQVDKENEEKAEEVLEVPEENEIVSERDAKKEPLNCLKVVVIRARRLKAMDRSGTSDPYVVISADGETRRTLGKQKTLAPVWLERFQLSVERSEAVARFTVMDADIMESDDVIGVVSVPLRELSNELPRRQWFPLEGNSETEDLGELELCLRWIHEPKFYFKLPDTFQEPDEEARNLIKNELCVYIIRVRGLAEKKGAQHPVVTLKLEHEVRETKIGSYAAMSSRGQSGQTSNKKAMSQPSSKHPNRESVQPQRVFCEQFAIAADLDEYTQIKKKAAGTKGILEVAVNSKKLALGKCQIDVSKKKSCRRFYALEDPDHGNTHGKSGRIEVAYLWRHNPDLVLEVPEDKIPSKDTFKHEEANEICIYLLRARKLKVMDKTFMRNGQGSTDCYLTFHLNNQQSCKSTVKYKSLAPIWQDCFFIDAQGLKTPLLTVTAYDHDTMSAHDYMGSFVVEVSTLLKDRERHRQWFRLSGKEGSGISSYGEIELALLYRHNPQRVLPLPIEFTQVEDDFSQKPNLLLCTLVRATALLACDTNLLTKKATSSDPFVELELLGERRKSKTKSSELNPIWSEFFSFPCEYSEAKLSLTVQDYDQISFTNDFMGQCQISIPSDRGVVLRKWYDLCGKDKTKDSKYGRIEIAMRFLFDPTVVVDYPSEFLRVEDVRTEEQNELAFVILRGSNFPKKTKLRAQYQSWKFGAASVTGPSPQILTSHTLPLEDTHDLLDPVLLRFQFADAAQEVSVKFDLTALKEERGKIWRRWLDIDGLARIECAARWLHNPGNVIPLPEHMMTEELHPKREANALAIVLLRGRNLGVSTTPENQIPDIFCDLRLCAEHVKSRTHKKNHNPDFGAEYFELPVESLQEALSLSVHDSRGSAGLMKRLTGQNKSINLGGFELNVRELADRQTHREWYSINSEETSGKIEVALRWYHQPNLILRIPADMTARERCPNMPINELQICLVRARNLPAMGKSAEHPKARFSINGISVESSVKKKTRYPVWMQRMDLFVDKTQLANSELDVTIFDYHSSSNCDQMGSFQVSLLDLADRTLHRKWHPLSVSRHGGEGQKQSLSEQYEKQALMVTSNNAQVDDDDEDSKTLTPEVELMLRLVYNPKSKHAYYDMTQQSELDKIATACFTAIETRDTEQLKLLVSRGASVRHATRGLNRATPLHELALREGSEALVDLLVQLNADIDQRDIDNHATPAHWAAKHNRPLLLRQLIIFGADLEACDKYGKRPAHYAAQYGADRSIKILSTLGVGLHHQTYNGRTPGHLAAEYGHASTLEMLKSLGQNIDLPGDFFGNRTPLICAAATAKGNLSSLAKLLDLGANLYTTDNDGCSAAHHAAKKNNKMALDFLKSNATASLDVPDCDNMTPAAYMRAHLNRSTAKSASNKHSTSLASASATTASSSHTLRRRSTNRCRPSHQQT